MKPNFHTVLNKTIADYSFVYIIFICTKYTKIWLWKLETPSIRVRRGASQPGDAVFRRSLKGWSPVLFASGNISCLSEARRLFSSLFAFSSLGVSADTRFRGRNDVFANYSKLARSEAFNAPRLVPRLPRLIVANVAREIGWNRKNEDWMSGLGGINCYK